MSKLLSAMGRWVEVAVCRVVVKPDSVSLCRAWARMRTSTSTPTSSALGALGRVDNSNVPLPHPTSRIRWPSCNPACSTRWAFTARSHVNHVTNGSYQGSSTSKPEADTKRGSFNDVPSTRHTRHGVFFSYPWLQTCPKVEVSKAKTTRFADKHA